MTISAGGEAYIPKVVIAFLNLIMHQISSISFCSSCKFNCGGRKRHIPDLYRRKILLFLHLLPLRDIYNLPSSMLEKYTTTQPLLQGRWPWKLPCWFFNIALREYSFFILKRRMTASIMQKDLNSIIYLLERHITALYELLPEKSSAVHNCQWLKKVQQFNHEFKISGCTTYLLKSRCLWLLALSFKAQEYVFLPRQELFNPK